jgi:hypothetical protein
LAQHIFDKPHWRAAIIENVSIGDPFFDFCALRLRERAAQRERDSATPQFQ